ncbi:MAG: insulinase family protein [Ignavibacteriae bacterium]|nr:insulinase family protein [Ignavibacteriota bacterium]
MKLLRNSIALFCALTGIISTQYSFAQKIDVTKRPDPLPAKSISFPAYKEFTLKNGLKVFLVEDHEQPTISLSMQIRAGEVSDKKAGTATLTAELLTNGAGKRSALQLAQKLDSIAIGISATSVGDLTTVTGAGLKKHFPLFISLFSDIVTKPTFSKEEFDKIIPQTLAAIKQEKSRPGSIAQAMSRKVIYGANHPNARRRSEASIKSITREDIIEFHSTHYKPNNSTLAVVGDITQKELTPMLEKAFADWKKSNVPLTEVPPASPMPVGMYFIARPGSVQSSIATSSLAVPLSNPDYESLSLDANMLGGSFGGRLFKTLRETYSYTYTPGAFLSRAKLMNRFVTVADVRNPVTDSAIWVIKQEISRMRDEKVQDEELTRIKRYVVGSYLLEFEKSNFVANILQNADYNGEPMEKIKSYPERYSAITPAQVQASAQKYLRNDQTSIIVVGSPDILPKLKAMGNVYEYNLDLEPVTATSEKVDISIQDLFQKHIQALGGKDKIASIKTLITKATSSLEAGPNQLQGTFTRKQKTPQSESTTLDLQVVKQQTWSNEKNVWTSRNGSPAQETPVTEAPKQKLQATILVSGKMLDLGYKAEIAAKKDGKYIVNVTTPIGDKETYYFDAQTFLVSEIDKTQTTPSGAIQIVTKFDGYSLVEGVMLPKKSTLENPDFNITHEYSYEVNTPIDDKEFAPPGK